MRAVINHICKSFDNPDGTLFNALQSISLTISEGEFVAVVGRSGCGKSTLLNIVAGLLPATEGEVVFEDLASDDRPLTSVVFQDLALFPWRSIKKKYYLRAGGAESPFPNAGKTSHGID